MTSPTPAEHTALPKLPLVYRSKAHDDWGCIRDASGLPVLRAGVFDRESVLDQHRRDGTDPVEAFCKSVITAVNERAGLLERVRKLEEALRSIDGMPFYLGYVPEEQVDGLQSRYNKALTIARAALQPEQETA